MKMNIVTGVARKTVVNSSVLLCYLRDSGARLWTTKFHRVGLEQMFTYLDEEQKLKQ